MEGKKIAVLGATGLVGKKILDMLPESNLPIKEVAAFASLNSKGVKAFCGDKKLLVKTDLEELGNYDIIFGAAPDNVAKEASKFMAKGAVFIDKSSAFRMNSEVPLVVPQINGHLTAGKSIIASPNCVVIPLALACFYVSKLAPIKRAVVATYQSVSGAGEEYMQMLWQQTLEQMGYGNTNNKIANKFPRLIGFNLFPEIGGFASGKDSGEEEKIKNEMLKILNIPVSVTAVRVPTFISHGMAVNLELKKTFSVRNFLKSVEDLAFFSAREDSYLTPLETKNTDIVHMGRIRKDDSLKHGLNFWLVCDNLRKGAALNAIEIAEYIFCPGKSVSYDFNYCDN